MIDLEELLEEAIEEQGDIKNVTIKNAGLYYKDFGPGLKMLFLKTAVFPSAICRAAVLSM